MSTTTEVFDRIAIQSGIDDVLLIERTFYECDSDEIKTIFKLMQIEMPKQKHEKNPRERTLFDDLRDICDEKDTMFQEILKNKRESKST
jgi:hypothetical protein